MRDFWKIFNAGTSEGVRKAWITRRGGISFKTEKRGNRFWSDASKGNVSAVGSGATREEAERDAASLFFGMKAKYRF